MVFTSIYGVVDGLFVSNFAGKTPFAAVNLVMPFIMIFGGVGFMFGTGGSALVAKTLGEQQPEKANRYFTMMVWTTLIVGVIISALGAAFMRPISIWLGADENMLEYCVIYGRITLLFNTSFMLQNLFQSFLITAEKPRLGLYATVAAAISFLRTFIFKLSAVLLLPLAFGLDGVWWATIFAETLAFTVSLAFLFGKRKKYHYM